MSRNLEVLRLAAEALDDMRDPFDNSFLVDNSVTAEECFMLAEQLAFGARLAIVIMEEIRKGGIHAQAAAMYVVRAGDV